MTFAPATLTALAAYWKQQGGVNLGIVGDLAHQRRASYHNGQDAIEKHGRTAATDYTIRLARDREPHLTNAAAAIDLGKLDGTLSELWRFSNWIVAECLTDATKRKDVREVIYSPDGRTVQRYDGAVNRVKVEGDDSHLWHTHISYYRDSEKRDKVALFSPFFLPDTDTEGGHDVAINTRGLTLESHHAVTLPAGTNVYEYPEDGAPLIGEFGGAVPYFGVSNGYKAVRVAGPDGSVIGYTSTGASVYDNPPDDAASFNAGVDAASKAALTAKR